MTETREPVNPPASGAGIARCDTGVSDHFRAVAQLGLERFLGVEKVGGSNPLSPTIFVAWTNGPGRPALEPGEASSILVTTTVFGGEGASDPAWFGTKNGSARYRGLRPLFASKPVVSTGTRLVPTQKMRVQFVPGLPNSV